VGTLNKASGPGRLEYGRIERLTRSRCISVRKITVAFSLAAAFATLIVSYMPTKIGIGFKRIVRSLLY